MAAFNFPNSPSTNDLHTENNVTWKWNGTVWKRINNSYLTASTLDITGISTLTGGINVGTAGTISSVGNLTFDKPGAGIVTATKYYGDGSALTGVTAGVTAENSAPNNTYSNNTGGSLTSNSEKNTLYGDNAGTAINTGDLNVCLGYNAGASLAAGYRNVVIGANAGDSINFTTSTVVGYEAATGSSAAFEYSALFGYGAGHSATSSYSVLIGRNAGARHSGNNNTIVGDSAGNQYGTYGQITGEKNVILGAQAGAAVLAAEKNTILGYDAGDALTTGSNNIIIGNAAAASAVGTSNEITLGDTNITNFRIPGIGLAASDGHLEVRDTKSNLVVAKTGLTVKGTSDIATSYDLIQLGAGGALASYSTATATADTQFIHNAYRHSGNNWKYRYADTAARLRVNSPARTWIFESAASGSADADITFAEQLRIDSSGRLLINNTTSNTVWGYGQGSLQVTGNWQEASASFINDENSTNSHAITLGKIRGSSIVQSGDFCGSIAWNGYDGSAYKPTARIHAAVDGTPGSGDMPGRIVFETTNDGGSTPVERLRIDSSGHMGLGITPSAWSTTGDFRGLQVGSGTALYGRASGDADRGGVSVNYYHTGSAEKYIAAGNANNLYMVDGEFVFKRAASGSANGTITWDTRCKINTEFGVKAENTCKAWLCYRGENGQEGILDDYNVATVSDEATGTFAVTFSRNLTQHSGGKYSLTFGSHNWSPCMLIAGVAYTSSHGSNNPWWGMEDNFVRIHTMRSDSNTLVDAEVFFMAVHGDTGDV